MTKDLVKCTCTNLRRATLAVTQFYDRALEPSGIKVTQFSVLRSIQRHEPLSISALAEAVGLDRTTLGRNLQVLERDGLVLFAPGTDQRVRAVRLTEQGRQTLAVAYPLWEAAQARFRTSLGDEQIGQLLGLLSQVETAAS